MARFKTAAHPPTDGSAAVPRLGSAQTSGVRTREDVASRITAFASRHRRAIVAAERPCWAELERALTGEETGKEVEEMVHEIIDGELE